MAEIDPGGQELALPRALSESRALTRRELVRRGGAAALLLSGGPALLAACGEGAVERLRQRLVGRRRAEASPGRSTSSRGRVTTSRTSTSQR